MADIKPNLMLIISAYKKGVCIKTFLKNNDSLLDIETKYGMLEGSFVEKGLEVNLTNNTSRINGVENINKVARKTAIALP